MTVFFNLCYKIMSIMYHFALAHSFLIFSLSFLLHKNVESFCVRFPSSLFAWHIYYVSPDSFCRARGALMWISCEWSKCGCLALTFPLLCTQTWIQMRMRTCNLNVYINLVKTLIVLPAKSWNRANTNYNVQISSTFGEHISVFKAQT